MRGLILLVGLIAVACGGNGGGTNDPDGGGGSTPDGGGEPAGTFDEEVGPFIDTLCMLQATCSGGDMQMCVNDATVDMIDAQMELDEAGEMRCAVCMHVKTREAQKVLDAGCNLDAGDMEAIFAACDLDPNVDYDGNGTLNDDDDEACAGYP